MRRSTVFVCIAGFLALALVVGVLIFRSQQRTTSNAQPASGSQEGNTTTAKVGPAGGSFVLSGMTIRVPPGAVPADTTLSVRPPRPAKDAKRPLVKLGKTSSVKFGVSLGGNLQPRLPLDVDIPLRPGQFLPAGGSPGRVLLYTPHPRAKGIYALVPSVVDGGGVLHARLAHLSPKWLTHVSNWGADNLFPEGVAKERPGPCMREAETNGTGKVKLVDPTGWSYDRSSPVHPCLLAENGKLVLKVINNSLPYWEAASSKATSIRPTAKLDVDAHMITSIARLIGTNADAQAHLVRGGELEVDIPAAALPSNTGLRTTDGTFHAENVWARSSC